MAAMLAAHAIKDAGDHPDRDKVCVAMANTKDLPSILGTGKLTIDQDRETN